MLCRQNVEEMPGVNTQGRTLAEARRNLKEALTLVLEANRSRCEKGRQLLYFPWLRKKTHTWGGNFSSAVCIPNV